MILSLFLRCGHEFTKTLNGIAANLDGNFYINWEYDLALDELLQNLTMIRIAEPKTLKNQHIISLKIEVFICIGSQMKNAYIDVGEGW